MMTFIKKWRIASITFSLLIGFASIPHHMSASAVTIPGNPAMLTTSFYAIGLGVRYLSQMLASTFSHEVTCDDEKKEEVLQKVKAIAIQSLVRLELEKYNARTNTPKELNAALMTAFDAGTRLPMIIDFCNVALDVINDFYSIGQQLGLQAMYAMKDGAQLSYESVVKGLFDVSHKSSDIPYPLKSYHGTQLHCGMKDIYCLHNEEQKKPELLSDTNALIANLFRLGVEGGGISLGVLLAVISYKIGNHIMNLLGVDAAKVVDGHSSVSVGSHIVHECVDTAVLEELQNTVHDSLHSLEELTPGDTSSVLNINDMQEAMKFGQEGRKLASAPPMTSSIAHKLGHLFKRKGSSRTH
jgi:hypothetical protein